MSAREETATVVAEILAEGDGVTNPGPTDIARELAQIRSDALAAAGKRSHLPQPLFWSLFHARLAELKSAKKRVRELEEIFSNK